MAFTALLVAFLSLLSFGISDNLGKKFKKPCFLEDELLNLCTDPIEICHEERADEIRLVRLDGVKVSTLLVDKSLARIIFCR